MGGRKPNICRRNLRPEAMTLLSNKWYTTTSEFRQKTPESSRPQKSVPADSFIPYGRHPVESDATHGELAILHLLNCSLGCVSASPPMVTLITQRVVGILIPPYLDLPSTQPPTHHQRRKNTPSIRRNGSPDHLLHYRYPQARRRYFLLMLRLE